MYEEILKYHKQNYQDFLCILNEEPDPCDEAHLIALEKQVPKEPVDKIIVLPIQDANRAYVDAETYVDFYCPDCGEWIGSDQGELFTFCPECGQRIAEVKYE